MDYPMSRKEAEQIGKAEYIDELTADIKAMGELNCELIVALNKCRTALDDIWFADPADKEDHALWAADQREAIKMAEAVLAKVRGE